MPRLNAVPNDDRARPAIHREVLIAIVTGMPGIRPDDLNRLYESVSELAYRDTLTEPITQRPRRKVLSELVEDGQVADRDTSGGRRRFPAAEDVETQG